MELTEICTVMGTILSLLAALITFVVKFFMNKSAKFKLENLIKLTDIIQPLVVKAEEFQNYTGAEKKQFVFTFASQFAQENKIKFDAQSVSDTIEKIVEVTKKVNARTKDITIEEPKGTSLSSAASEISTNSIGISL